MKTTVFALDPLPNASFEGYDTGEDWNGWAMPLFTFDQALKIVEAWRTQGWQADYSDADDTFVFSVRHDLQTGQSDETETFAGVQRDGQKYYPIGSGAWIWEEAESEVAFTE